MQVAAANGDRLAEWRKTSGNQPIPDGWKLVRLGEVSEHCLGKMLDQKKQVNGNRLPYLRNPNVQWLEFDLRNLEEMRFQQHELSRYEVKDGDVIICEGGEPGRAAIWSGGTTNIKFQKALHRVRSSDDLLNRFLVRRLQFDATSGRLDWYFTGTTIKHFTGQDLHRYLFPLPPLPEQQRIAAILDKADAIRRKREEGIRLTEELLRSTFLEMFGDPATNPKKWPTKAMGDIVQETQYGTAEKSNSDGIGLPVLRMNNITYGGEIDLTDLKWCEIKDSDLEQLTVKRGDLLFNRTNSPELVGKTAVWDRDERYAYAGYLFRVRFHENMVLPDYISGFLNSAYGKKMLFAKAKPSNNMSNFSAGEFCRIELPIPDIGIQRRFARVVAEIKRLKDKRAAGLKDATELFGALVQRAFRGELTNGEGT